MSLSAGHRPARYALVLDRRTGALAESTQFDHGDPPVDLHPLLAERLTRLYATASADPAAVTYVGKVDGTPLRTGGFPHPAVAGAEAETYAVSMALWDRERRGLPVDQDTFPELVVDCQMKPPNETATIQAPVLANAAALLDGAQLAVGTAIWPGAVEVDGEPPVDSGVWKEYRSTDVTFTLDELCVEAAGHAFVTGTVFFVDNAGRRIGECRYFAGLKDGVEQAYARPGEDSWQRTFRGGLLHGPSRSWHANRQLATELNYDLGVLTARRTWTENGHESTR